MPMTMLPPRLWNSPVPAGANGDISPNLSTKLFLLAETRQLEGSSGGERHSIVNVLYVCAMPAGAGTGPSVPPETEATQPASSNVDHRMSAPHFSRPGKQRFSSERSVPLHSCKPDNALHDGKPRNGFSR